MDRMPVSQNPLAQLVQGIVDGGVEIVDLSHLPMQECRALPIPIPLYGGSPSNDGIFPEIDETTPAWYSRVTPIKTTPEGSGLVVPPLWELGVTPHEQKLNTIPLRRLCGPACVIDISQMATEDPDYLLTRRAVLEWERQHGIVPCNSWVLLRSDWSKRRKLDEFLNSHKDGPHWPGFSKGCTQFLAQERNVLGIGVETADVDAGQAGKFDPPFWTQKILQDHGRYSLTKLSNLDKLPPMGAFVILSPLRITRGARNPTRVIALIPN